MLRKDQCLPANEKVVSDCYIFFDKQAELYGDVNMTPLKVEDELLIKTAQTKKG